MLKYAFNGFLFSQRQTGVMRFAREILQRMDKLCENDSWVLVVPEYAEHVPKLKNISVVKCGNTRGNFWEQKDFAKFVRKNKFESVNFNNTMPLRKPGIIAIHDIAYKIHPEFASSIHGKISNIYHRMIFRKAAKSNKPIITVTHFSKIQLVEHYGIDPNRITVIGNAWQHFQGGGVDNTVLEKNGLIDKSFYFCLGSLSKMKNTKWIFEVARRNPNALFVLAGAKPNNESDEFENSNNVLRVGFVSDEQVKALIQSCKAFIYPSIYDGFGIPPLEALSQGANVICSTAACLPEVYRNSVHYIDPYEYDVDIDELMKEPIDSAEAVLSRYSWDKSALQLYRLLKNNEVEN